MQLSIALFQDHETDGIAVFKDLGEPEHTDIEVMGLLNVLDGKHGGNPAKKDALIGDGIHRGTSNLGETGQGKRTVPKRCCSPFLNLQDGACGNRIIM